MTPDEYEKIKAFCKKTLVKKYHGNHLEDLTQYVAMKHFESGGSRGWKFLLIDYLRANGLVLEERRNNQNRAVLTRALSLDYRSDKDSNDSYHLAEESLLIEERIPNPLETFLKPLNLNLEVLEWIIQNCKVKTKSKYGRRIGVEM